MSYIARHVVDALTTPLVAALLLAVAAALLWIRGRRRAAGALWVCTGVLVYVLSLVPVGDALLRPLETQYRSPGVGLRCQLCTMSSPWAAAMRHAPVSRQWLRWIAKALFASSRGSGCSGDCLERV